jgi:transcriptional regulator with XRE-family HTH domain
MAKTMSEVLRIAILSADRSRYALAQESGVSQAQLSRFVSGERSLRLDSADRIAEALGLRLVPSTKQKGSKR